MKTMFTSLLVAGAFGALAFAIPAAAQTADPDNIQMNESQGSGSASEAVESDGVAEVPEVAEASEPAKGSDTDAIQEER